MSRHARGRRTVARPARPSTAKHLRHRRVLPSLRSLVSSVGYPRVMVALLALAVAVLMILPGAGAGGSGRRQQADAQIGSAAVSRPATTRKPKKARPTTTLQATTTSVPPTSSTVTASTVTASIGAGAAGLTSKPGPSPEITCPTGAVDISPGTDIQAKINANASGTVFCLRAGRHTPATAYLDPSPGDVFIGEYGAVVDGQHLRKESFSYRYGPSQLPSRT
jgi:hypothetical protein